MKNKKSLIFFISLISLLLVSITTFAHPGRLDSNGGHWNHDTGEYHYHSGSNSSDSSYNYDYDYDYTTTKKSDNIDTTANYKKSAEENYKKMFGESTEKTSDTNNSIDINSKQSNEDSDNILSSTLLVFILIILFITLLLIFFLYNKEKNKIEHILNQLNRLNNNNKQIVDKTNEVLKNSIDFNNGFERGLKSGTREITPQLIEKAYQIGIRDAEKIKEQNEYRKKLFAQGCRINIDVETSQTTADYIKEDNTVSTEPFVSIGQSLEELLRTPNGIKINTDLLISDTEYPDDKFGRYTVYQAHNGGKLHLVKNCSGANLPSLSFKYNGRDNYNRCSKCFSHENLYLLNIPEWYKDFRTYKQKKQNGHIGTYETDFL
ncbi:MAG: YHYH domain-containing protein [Bacteroides sp.]|nr:YHYH domain-containing protein [Bacteroides sp.]MCM1434399.1 YHYH domain-containing protein [Clostridiales bacterium]